MRRLRGQISDADYTMRRQPTCTPDFLSHVWQVLPEAPKELVSELSRRYIWLYQAITGQDFRPAPQDVPPNERMKQNLSSVL